MAKKKICIDPGHYGSNYNHGVDAGYVESNFTFDFSFRLKRYLEAGGFEVIMTRTNKDANPDLTARGRMSAGCVCFISIHSNACGKESVTRPVGMHMVSRPETDIDEKSIELAKGLAAVVQKVMGLDQTYQVYSVKSESDRDGNGRADDNYYGVLHGAFMVKTPGIILEHSFHTNHSVCHWLMNSDNLERMAKAEADYLIKKYLGSAASEDTGDLTMIVDNPVATAEQCQAYIKRVNPSVAQSVIDMIPLYFSEGKALGIRGDVAFAQSCLETGNFTFVDSAVTLDQNNFCGMGVTSTGMKGNSFQTPQLGIRAQMQHLFAYASRGQLPNECVDPRFKYVTRGCAPYVEWLGQKENPQGLGWASGANYGPKIMNIISKITGTAAQQPGGSGSGSGEAIVDASGFLKVTYQGNDGVNVRTEPKFGNNVDRVLKASDTIYTIVGKSADGLWYKLKSGLYITTGTQYVTVYKTMEEAKGESVAKSFEPYTVRVSISNLNIRRSATIHSDARGYTGKGVFTIVAEKKGPVNAKGTLVTWGLLKAYQKNEDGWICLDYTTRL